MNTLLAYIQFIFIGLVIYGSVLTFGVISINTSMSGIVAPILAWFAGTGLRASFNRENNNQKKGSELKTVNKEDIRFLSVRKFSISKTAEVVVGGYVNSKKN